MIYNGSCYLGKRQAKLLGLLPWTSCHHFALQQGHAHIFLLQRPIYSTQINTRPYYSKALPRPQHGDWWVTLVSGRHVGGSHTAPGGVAHVVETSGV